jgi:hypothetical protein
MKKIVLNAVLTLSLALAAGSVFAQSFGSAAGNGYGDGLIEEGRGGVMTAGESSVLTRADTAPEYATGVASDQRGLMMGSQGRNGAKGDFLMLSESATVARLNGAEESADAKASGNAAYDAQAVGRMRYTEGGAVGRSRTEALALEVPGGHGDRAESEADQTSAAGAVSMAADRRAARAASSAVASASAEANDTE